MNDVDRFFDDSRSRIKLDSRAAVRECATKLQQDVQRQIRQNFKNPSLAKEREVTAFHYEDASYVRLSPILSSHAEEAKIQGKPNLWILLPEGQKLGFKRIGIGGFTWSYIKRRYGRMLSFIPVVGGHILLYRDGSRVVPIYKIQQTVATNPRIKFYEKAEEIAFSV